MSLLHAAIKYPFLVNPFKLHEAIKKIQPTYQEYVSIVSTPEMTISLKTAGVIYVLCNEMQPKKILDLGSGFSSFVFRLYAGLQNDIVIVSSIDDNTKWLNFTKRFLSRQKISTDGLYLWDEFKTYPLKEFDLILHDLGDMCVRISSLPSVLRFVKKNSGLLLLDDMHKEEYRSQVFNLLETHSFRYIKLDYLTKDNFGRYCGLAYDIEM